MTKLSKRDQSRLKGRAHMSRASFRLRLYNLFRIGPKQTVHSYETVLGLLLAGTVLVFSFLLLMLLFSTFVAGNEYVITRVYICATILIFICALLLLWRKFKHYKLAALLLVFFYGTIAVLCMMAWGISTPFALLMGGFVVVLSGILLGARGTLWAAGTLSLVMLCLQVLIDKQLLTPTPQVLYPSRYGDVVGFAVIFGIIALVSWISSRQMERALQHALRAEEALKKEKASLAERLDERTRSLQSAQLQEMQQLYRFAELGQLSTALLHDLSNHLTVLTLDIEDLHKQQRHSKAIQRAKDTIFHLDKMVDQVRARLHEEGSVELFKPVVSAREVLDQLQPKAQKSKVTLKLEVVKDVATAVLCGDGIRFAQVLAIVVSNAIDAYLSPRFALPEAGRVVDVQLSVVKKSLRVIIRDYGIGIKATERKKLFKPFFSTKYEGMGIGLFIARQMVEIHFGGTIVLNPSFKYTEFIITIPIHSHHEVH